MLAECGQNAGRRSVNLLVCRLSSKKHLRECSHVLVIKPVAYGGGLPIFRDLAAALRLDLIEARTFDGGVVLHRYTPA
jgi:hypothetical protein